MNNCPRCNTTPDHFGHYPQGREYNIGCWNCGHKWFEHARRFTAMDKIEQGRVKKALLWDKQCNKGSEVVYRGFQFKVVGTRWEARSLHDDEVTLNAPNIPTLLHIIWLITKDDP